MCPCRWGGRCLDDCPAYGGRNLELDPGQVSPAGRGEIYEGWDKAAPEIDPRWGWTWEELSLFLREDAGVPNRGAQNPMYSFVVEK